MNDPRRVRTTRTLMATIRKGVLHAPYIIRPSRPDDAATLVDLVRELARSTRSWRSTRRRRPTTSDPPVRPAARWPRRSWPRSDGAAGRLRALLHDVLDLPRPAGHLPRRPLRPARAAGPGDRQGPAGEPWPGPGRRARLRPARMVGAQLERAGDRLLRGARRPADGRLDRLPARRRAVRPAGQRTPPAPPTS